MLTVMLSVRPSQVIEKRDCAVMVRDALPESSVEEKFGPVMVHEETSMPCQEISDCDPELTLAGEAEISTEGTVIKMESLAVPCPPAPVQVMLMLLLPGERILLISAKLSEGAEIPRGAGEEHEVAFVEE
jgi:hypothetical protein